MAPPPDFSLPLSPRGSLASYTLPAAKPARLPGASGGAATAVSTTVIGLPAAPLPLPAWLRRSLPAGAAVTDDPSAISPATELVVVAGWPAEGSAGVLERVFEAVDAARITDRVNVVVAAHPGEDGASVLRAASVPQQRIHRAYSALDSSFLQHVLFVRFSNRIFEPLLSARHVESVQVVHIVPMADAAADRPGFEARRGVRALFAGGPLLPLLCSAAMDEPVSLDAADCRKERIKVLKCLEASDRPPVVARDSAYGGHAPTFAAMHLNVHNSRWSGTPFLVAAAYCPTQVEPDSFVRIVFKDGGNHLFGPLPNNELVIKLHQSSAGSRVSVATTKLGGGHGVTVPLAEPTALVDDFLADASVGYTSADEDRLTTAFAAHLDAVPVEPVTHYGALAAFHEWAHAIVCDTSPRGKL